MGGDVLVWDRTFIAGADLTGKQFYAVKHGSGANEVVLSGDGEEAIGILQTEATQGRGVSVRLLGESWWVAGASVTAGAKVGSGANGKAAPKTNAAWVLGTAPTGVTLAATPTGNERARVIIRGPFTI
jgi:hypothetical protein